MSKSTNVLAFFGALAVTPIILCTGLIAVGNSLDSTFENPSDKYAHESKGKDWWNCEEGHTLVGTECVAEVSKAKRGPTKRSQSKRWTKMSNEEKGIVCTKAADKLFRENGITPDAEGLYELGLGCAVCLNTAGKEADYLPASDAAYTCATLYIIEKAK